MASHVCPGDFFFFFFFFFFFLDSRLAIFGKEIVLLAFCLECFDCGAIALNVFFFPFGVLDRRCVVTVSILIPFYFISAVYRYFNSRSTS